MPIFTGGVALAVICGFGIWFVSPPSPPAESSVVVARAAVERPSVRAPARAVANPFGGLVEFAAPQPTLRRGDPNGYGSLVASFPDSPPAAAEAPHGASRSLGPVVGTLEAAPPAAPVASAPAVADAPLPPRREVASLDDSAPLPPARPSEFAALESPAPAATDKALGPSRSLGPALAYAAPDTTTLATPAAPAKTSIFSIFSPQPTRPAGYDDHTAVYDITGRVLYLPDGTKIEAHSGLGEYMDDPNHVNERLRGATPPDLYDLQPRESLFHGIAAIRLLPVGGEEAIYGRAGLLAHPFMMGDNGDSNGCVSIKDYDAFLKAFQDGKVTRLAVVAKL
ncbi:MAG: tlde1 domain-containing protein [Roseiarcus sp.]